MTSPSSAGSAGCSTEPRVPPAARRLGWLSVCRVPSPSRPFSTIGRLRSLVSSVTVSVDPHVHSAASYDGHEPVELILEHAAEIGLDAVAITDHDTMGASRRAAAIAGEYGLIGIPRAHVSTAPGHLLALAADRMPPRRTAYPDTIRWLHDHGCVAILPHPLPPSRPAPPPPHLHHPAVAPAPLAGGWAAHTVRQPPPANRPGVTPGAHRGRGRRRTRRDAGRRR